MKYVLGIDLGTSSVKILLLNNEGMIVDSVSKEYPLVQERPGYNEQNPELWIAKTTEAVKEIVNRFVGDISTIEGISFSGQMHGLVLLDEDKKVLRNAILWNDTRTTKQCKDIYRIVGEQRLLSITKNPALEGFTLPKLLWVKQNEPELYKRIDKMILPKDYLRYKISGNIHSEYSDAAGTLLLDVAKKEWSKEITDLLDIDQSILPKLVESTDLTGTITKEFSEQTGLNPMTKVFAGGADNACGALGAGILSEGMTLCSIGTSGVILSYEKNSDLDFGGQVHYFNHTEKDAYYTMGVTLAAGHSLTWYRETFAPNEDFETLLSELNDVPLGSNGLIFTPYISGERTPHHDSLIRGSFIGMTDTHQKKDFTRAVIEGITFSLNESIETFREHGKTVETIVSIGGGARSEEWLQIQADIFNAKVIKLSSEQGPALGAAMIAGYGCNWVPSLQDFSEKTIKHTECFVPNKENVKKYKELFKLYKDVYHHTKELNVNLEQFR